MQVLVAGHSFVRRLRDDLSKRGKTLTGDKARVTMVGIGGAYTQGPKSMYTTIAKAFQKQHFEIVFLELGSNDINRAGSNIPQIVDNYISEVLAFCARHNTNAVLCLPIPRAEDQFPGSWDKTVIFNNLLTAKVLAISNITIWVHKGLFKRTGQFLRRDGIHLNDRGNVNYFFSLLNATNKFAGCLRDGSFKS